MPNNEQNVALIKGFLNAFNQHALDDAMAYIANEAVLIGDRGETIDGKPAITKYIGEFFKGFPNVNANFNRALFATDEWGFAEWTITGVGETKIIGGDLFGFKNGQITFVSGLTKQLA